MVSAASPTRAWSTGVRRPMCSARTSSCTTVEPVGYQSRYGKSEPTISSTSAESIACAAAGLPRSPDCPTANGLSASIDSFALSVTTIGAASASASASTCVRALRAPHPTSRVTLSALARTSAARATWSVGAADGAADGANRDGAVDFGSSRLPTSPGTVSTATPPRLYAALTACSSTCGSCSGELSVPRHTATSANTASLSTSWKKSVPISALGTCPQIARTGACDFLAS